MHINRELVTSGGCGSGIGSGVAGGSGAVVVGAGSILNLFDIPFYPDTRKKCSSNKQEPRNKKNWKQKVECKAKNIFSYKPAKLRFYEKIRGKNPSQG